MGCGDISFLDGGTLTNSTVVSPQIANGTIQSSTFDNGTITALSSIDDSSLEKLVDGMAKLPANKLAPLLEALLKAVQSVPGSAPTSSEESSLPTTIVGDRTSLMGAPASWQKFGETTFVFPLYKVSA